MPGDDPPIRQEAERAIGRIAADMARRLERGDLTAGEMILACRRILDLWVQEIGGSSMDDEVIGVLGIESQCDHVMLRAGQRKPRFPEYRDESFEIESLGRFFRDAFAREMRELAARFSEAP
jgi:hypothetical protein